MVKVVAGDVSAWTALTGGLNEWRAALKKLKPDIYELGEAVELAVEAIPLSARMGRGQRTSLPAIPEAQANLLGPGFNGEMVLQAVKEAKKTPEWMQAAVDFVLGNLALGRPDHIHICGGGNTLVYRNRLIRGYMTEHLDSRKESQAQFKKILYRETNNPVRVAVRGNVLHEVVRG
jgi:hypothetical protein